MEPTLLLSTRKGLFVVRAARDQWRIAHTAFLGDNVSYCHSDARDGSWYAALDLGHFGAKLHRSRDCGETWEELPAPAFAEGDEVVMGDGKPPVPATLRLIWCLAAGAADQPGRLWAGTIPGGLFRSDDHGQSWRLMRGLWDRDERKQWFGGGYDWPGIHSICIDPRDSRVIRIAISTGGVWRSEDDGETWTISSAGMYNVYMPEEQREDPIVQDVHRMVQCAAAPDVMWAQHHNAVFRSEDGGRQWIDVPNVAPSVFGFPVAVHPHNPDVAWFVPAQKDICRLPVEAQVVVARTRDGARSFEVLRAGLPQENAYDLVYRHGLAVDASGDRLAIASTTGGVWLSEDQGEHWRALEARLPPVYAVVFA